jgi:hypothetical protein
MSLAEPWPDGEQHQIGALPLPTLRGVLLLPNGNTQSMFSSFAAVNPGGPAQMVNLGSGGAGR